MPRPGTIVGAYGRTVLAQPVMLLLTFSKSSKDYFYIFENIQLPKAQSFGRTPAMTRLLFLFFSLSLQATLAQTISGKVINTRTKEPLAFVHIAVAGSARGATTDVEGRFQIQTRTGDTLVFSSVGFEKRKLSLQNPANSLQLVELTEKPTELNDVVVRAGENPAWRILRKVIANRDKNDPENLSSFSYNSYNKFFADMVSITTPLAPDTSKAKKMYDNSHLLFFESYTKRYYKKPNQTKEIILGNRMTGIRDPFLSYIATDIQSFSFYAQFITIMDKQYINPVAGGFENRYDVVLEETIGHALDTTFIVSFQPLRGKTFHGLKGQLHISSDGYALQHVMAGPDDDQALITVTIHHVYEKAGSHWFPAQLNTELFCNEFGPRKRRLKYTGRSYITNIEIEKEIDNNIFGTLNVAIDPKANHRDNTFWEANRTDSLSGKDLNTFRLYDSLKPKQLNSINNIFKITEAIVTNKINAGPVYFPFPDLLRFNVYEKVRVGLGVQTGNAISKYVSISAYGGYGLNDRALKYGAGIQFNLPSRREIFLRLNWKNDLAEPGASQLLKSPTLGNEIFRTWATSRMDSIENIKLEIGMRPLPFSELMLSIKQETRNPTYRYRYAREATADSTFNLAEVAVAFRYAVGETLTQIRDTKIVTGVEYPQFYITVSKSIAGILNGEYGFTKIEAKIENRFRLRGFGTTLTCLQGGISSGNIPYPYLFNGKGSKFSGSPNGANYIGNHFQTMGLYEFVSDRYVYFFLNHNFGPLTSRHNKTFRPELSFLQHIGYGTLKSAKTHEGLLFKTLEKGYLESGMLISNLLRFKYVKLFYLGLGGGVFYRYGSNALPKQADNFAWKLVLSGSF